MAESRRLTIGDNKSAEAEVAHRGASMGERKRGRRSRANSALIRRDADPSNELQLEWTERLDLFKLH